MGALLKKLFIVLFGVLGLPINATTITATIETRTSASLACVPNQDMPPKLAVQYINTGDKGQVTGSDSAVLVLSGIPEGTIQQISLGMSSNSNSGSATILITLDNRSWQVASGPYRDWPGVTAFSKTEQAIPCLKQPINTTSSSVLRLVVRGTGNSVYLHHMNIEMSLVPEQPHIVTLRWLDSQMRWQTSQLQEPSVRGGVVLPSVPASDSSIYCLDTTWHFVGWSEQIVDETDVEPLHWEPNDWYVPESDLTLHALYSNAKTYTIYQDTSLTTGEYVLAYAIYQNYAMLNGPWSDQQITMCPISLSLDQQGYCLSTPFITDSARYLLTFANDSVTIRNVATQQWIGYNQTKGSNLQKKWAYLRADQGSLFIYSTGRDKKDEKENTYWVGKSLVLAGDMDEFYGDYIETWFNPDYSYWLLFPVDGLPASSTAMFATLSSVTGLTSAPSRIDLSGKCVMLPNHQIVIIHNHKSYNLLGKTL